MIVYINGIARTACESRSWGKRCRFPEGHDGKHNDGSHYYWTDSEASTSGD